MSSTNDPIADLLTRIRNATRAQHRFVDLPKSRLNAEIVRVLKEEGFVQEFQLVEEDVAGYIRAELKYAPGRVSLIHGLKRVSKPGLRRYVSCSEIPFVCGGLGIAILSTSCGVMTGKNARAKHVGGELLCTVW